jgi:hypothetical protein
MPIQLEHGRMNKIEIRPEFLRLDDHVFLKHIEKVTIISR